MDISVVVGALLVLVAIVLVLLVLRRLRLLRTGGVHVSLRTRLDDSGKGWHLGVGRYHGDEFAWFRVLSVRIGPDLVIHRSGLEIAERREPGGVELYKMPAGSQLILRCRASSGSTPHDVEIAMGAGALTGFLSWLESAPPGRRLPWAS